MTTNSGLTPGGASYPLLTDAPHPDNIKEPVVELDQRAPVIAADVAALNSILDEEDRTDRLGWLTNTNELVGWDGDDWLVIGQPPKPHVFAQAWGTETVNYSNQQSKNQTVTFEDGLFTQTPIVMVTAQNWVSGTTFVVGEATGISTSGFTLRTYDTLNSNRTFSGLVLGWHATQASSDSGSGSVKYG